MSSALFTPLTKYCLWSPVPIKPRKVAPFQTAPYIGVRPEEIGVFVRSDLEIIRAKMAVENAKLECHLLSPHMNTQYNRVSVGPMHLAKGLEFKAIFVMACDDEIIPNQLRLESAVDEADLEEIYQTERHLLYVACTRARDFLMVSGVEPVSEFLEDMGAKKAGT